jgi:kumamolisin
MKEELAMEIPADHQRLEGSYRRSVHNARLIGAADPEEVLSVIVRVRRRPDAPALPSHEEWAAIPPEQRKILSRQDLAEQYGAAQSDVDKIADFACNNGLTVLETSVARRTVAISGTVRQLSNAFKVELGRYETPKETYRGREGYIHLPADLAGIVEGVFGLDNRRMARSDSDGTDSGASTLTPPQVARLYNFPGSPSAGGQTIGILEFGGPAKGSNPIATTGYNQGDVQLFINSLGADLTTPKIISVSVDQAPNLPAGSADNLTLKNANDIEVALDIQVAASVAQGANIVVYFAPATDSGWVDGVTSAVHDAVNSPSVLSISWGWPELEADSFMNAIIPSAWPFEWTQQTVRALNQTFQEAAMVGMTVFASSGDNGSNCEMNDGNAHVQYPASDPWVTACGGTRIENVSGNKFDEVAWNDETGATGGGISYLFDQPSWQAGANIPVSANPDHRKGRGVPDVAGNASSHSGYALWLYGKPTTALKLTSGPGAGVAIGTPAGTSAVAPLYAALVALINASLGRPVGYLNPTLYALSGCGVCRDISAGANNSISFKNLDGTTAASPGYASVPGWDACTGLGVIDGQALLAALKKT